MENINKTVIWNAVLSYFLIWVSLLFLISKEPNVWHPFVKSHVKSAFILHILMWITIFVMSYGLGNGIEILTYSLNSIITAGICLIIFSAMIYGAAKAHNGKTISIWEMFHVAKGQKNIISTSSSESIKESQASIIILSQIPFIGYIIWVRNINTAHVRDVLQLNFITTLTATILFIIWYTSLASLMMLAYIIWSVMQAIKLFHDGKISSFSIDFIPTVEEKYILQKSSLSYLMNSLKKDSFIPFSKIRNNKTLQRQQEEKQNEKELTSPNTYIKRNLIMIIIIAIFAIYFFDFNSPIMILFLFPLSYLIWYSEDRKAYKMPYIYDIYALISGVLYKLTHIFSTAKKLKNTTKTASVKISDTKK